MSTTQAQTEKNQTVDVTPEETHFAVQCIDIRLISSSLNPNLTEADVANSSRLVFRIHAVVEEQTSYSYLEVYATYPAIDVEDIDSYELSFVLMGIFRAQDDSITPKDLGEFVRMYTLTILWPYAREYATEQLRRAGIDHNVLPIINPQVVTKHIVENNLVEVEILEDEDTEK
jgi:preprotein translocase subunit SecB